jgi:50S ribosomal protein L16 3-hydroxylase
MRIPHPLRIGLFLWKRRMKIPLESIKFGALSLRQFMREYWQQKPLLIRNAWPGFRSPLSPDALAGLACETGIESRLVLEHGKRPWELRHGPFDETEFARLPETHWTLLVQDVEKHLPQLSPVVDRFRFIPNWRIDDLMISYAAPGGSVGPHTDNYDVFLLQAYGRRHWHISFQAYSDKDLLPNVDLRVLRDFHSELDWILEPGDMLYLPPRIAHHGVAVDACMTYSIGFRAPNQEELANHLFDTLLQEASCHSAWYRDPKLAPTADPGLISPSALSQLRQLMRSVAHRDDAWLNQWLGCYLTQPKDNLAVTQPPKRTPLSTFQTQLRQKHALTRRPGSQCSYIKHGTTATLFIDGQTYPLDRTSAHLGSLLTRQTRYEIAELFPRGERPSTWQVLHTLHLQHQLSYPRARR